MSEERSRNYGIAVTRVALGGVLLSHGLLKIFVFTIPGTVGFFQGLGLPAIVAYLTILGEIVGGTAILLGLYTRLAALLCLPILIGATWAHSGYGWVFSNQGGGWEFPLFLVVMAVAVAFQGSGAFALRKISMVDLFISRLFRV